jgi:sentrin-specific protease 7
MFFDSLKFSGKRQTTAAAKLIRRYLTREFQSQKPNDHFEFTYKNLPAEYPKVPRQPNSCDCGLFVCQFAESFFMNPISDYQSPIALMEWFSSCSVVSHKRQELRSLIEELGMKQTQTDKPTRN